LEKARFAASSLGAVIREIRYGTGTPPPYVEASADTVPFVRATDIKEGEVVIETLFHIEKEQPKSLEKCRLAGDELIVVRSGVNTGDCAVIPKSLAGAFAAYDLILTFHKTAVPRFVSTFLDTEIGRLQLNLVKGRAAQPHINAEEVSALRMPLPKPEIQRELVAAMDAARAERRAKLAEADALLAGLDGFLLATLGLTPQPKDDRKVFAVRAKTVPGRFDPHFYLPGLMQNLRMLTGAGAEALGSLVSFSDEVWKPAEHDKPTFRYIEISSVSPHTGEAQAEETPVAEAPSRARMAVRTGDIIVSLTRPHHGSIAQITPALNGCVASTGFSVLRNLSQRVNREYLWCVLRTRMCLKQMLQRASGGNYPAITEQELAKVLVPVPTPEVQEAIATEARGRREEARRLHADAEAGWQAAKRWFEEQLLGPAQP
jgi:type I restriction enzyme, S subunit